MSANTTPIFTRSALLSSGTLTYAQVSAANTNRDGTGTVVTVVTGGADGTRIDSVLAKAIVTTTAGMVRLYLGDGTNIRLIHEMTVDAITASGTVVAWVEEWTPTQPIILAPSDLLIASTNNAEAINVFAFGAHY